MSGATPDPDGGTATPTPAAALVVDTSAVVAIVRAEPTAAALVEALRSAVVRTMSAASLVEAGMVLEGRAGAGAAGVAESFVRDVGVEVVPVDGQQALRALEGWRRFGKGRHLAGLNYGDCFTYALAVTTGYPVLCVGTDFARTDVPVLPAVAGTA